MENGLMSTEFQVCKLKKSRDSLHNSVLYVKVLKKH